MILKVMWTISILDVVGIVLWLIFVGVIIYKKRGEWL